MTLFNPWHSPPPTQEAKFQSCKKKDETFQVYACLSGVWTESLDFHCFGSLLAWENELRGNKEKCDMKETFSLGFLASLHQSIIIMIVIIMIIITLIIIVFSSSRSSW